MRLTIDEYSKYFKMSKEMINSKLRNKKLNYIIEDGITYIIVTRSSLKSDKRKEIHEEKKEEMKQTEQKKEQAVSKPKTTVAMVLGLYQKENQHLKEKIVQLEAKIDSLIADKEQMLRDEMAKIEQVYSDKDTQLKTILELINHKLEMEKQETIHEVETIESPKEQESEKEQSGEKIIELKSYLKTLDLENYQRKIIKKRFLAVMGKDVRIIKQNGKLFLDFSKYDYSDLLEY